MSTMRHHVWAPADTYPVALLMKETAFNKAELQKNYVAQLAEHGLSENNVVAFTLSYNQTGKAPVKHIKDYLESLLPELTSLQTTHLYVTDSAYFKVLTGATNASVHHGYVLPCKIKDFTHFNVVLGINYQAMIYDPSLSSKRDAGIKALADHISGAYEAPGSGIIHEAVYPGSHQAIQEALNALHEYEHLTADIEAFSLRFNEAGIGTMALAPDKHRFVAFPCDYKPNEPQIPLAEKREDYGRFVPDPVVRAMIKQFLCTYKGKLTWHNAGYDLKVLIYTLWMRDLRDTAGLLEGLEVVTRLFDDTKLIAYLATNNTAGNVLGLKPLALEYAGNWAQDDIKDIRKIPLAQLLQYNGVDCLATHYVKEKYEPIMVSDKQLGLYTDLFLPSVKTILQMELTGMPISIKELGLAKTLLEGIQAKHFAVVMAHPIIKEMTFRVQMKAMEDANAKLKVKVHPFEKFADVEFNPNSGPQLQLLLYELMALPVIDLTDTKQPATGAETIEKLIHHATDQVSKDLLAALIGHGQVSKILSTFIPAFEKGIIKAPDGIIWLHGSFNLGGTVSGRLSSSDPNMQNIPAKSIFAKVIKAIFMAPPGWIFAGADFNSLEDMISALTTKDPNKLKVYTDGFDGHSLRAAYYSKDQLIAEGINIDLNDPKSVNQLKKMPSTGNEHPVRQDSKAPTFLLTYGGTYHGMMNNLGWTMEKSQAIENNYHLLYTVSDEYVAKRIEQATKDGYVEVAFGLRLRTPLLKQVIYGSSRMPYEAQAEGRTAGNALGQSYGLLNNRAANAFMQKVWASPYRLDIMPCALIHDAIYILFREDPAIAEWVNRELIAAMEWQELDEIKHPTVKLGAALDIYWPSWGNAITLPNGACANDIVDICAKAKQEYLNPKPKKEAT